MGRLRVVLDVPEGQRTLAPGSHVIGRSEEVEIVLKSSRASRRHAKLEVREDGATIEDLNSANGTYVNGVQVDGRLRLQSGDFIVIGDLGLEILFQPLDEASPSALPPTAAAPKRPEGVPDHPSTTRVNAADVLEAVADRAIASGMPEQAERVMERFLSHTLDDVRAGKRITDEVRERALKYSLLIGVELRAKRWVDYEFELLTALRMPLTPERAKTLADAIARQRPTPDALAAYEEMLRGLPASNDVKQSIVVISRWRAALVATP